MLRNRKWQGAKDSSDAEREQINRSGSKIVKKETVLSPPVRKPVSMAAMTATDTSRASSLWLRNEHQHLCCFFISYLSSEPCRSVRLSFCLPRERFMYQVSTLHAPSGLGVSPLLLRPLIFAPSTLSPRLR